MRISHITCIALVLMLLGATTSFADSEAHAFSDISTTYDYDADGTGYSITGAPMGTYDWSYSLHVHALAGFRGSVMGDSYANASASASVNLFGQDTISISVSAQWSGGIVPDSDEDFASDSGTVATRFGVSMDFSEYCEAETCWDNASSGSQVYARCSVVTSGSIL
jgi:hypothetical protein